MRSLIRFSLVLLLWVGLASAQHPRIDAACEVIWDYPSDVKLSAIVLYVSETPGTPPERPFLPLPAHEGTPRKVACMTVASMLPHTGIWSLWVQAWGPEGERSDLSEPLIVQYGEALIVQPPYAPPAPGPAPPIPMPPLVRPLPPVWPLPPVKSSPWLTEAPNWRSPAVAPPRLGPPIVLPPVSKGSEGEWLTKTCGWTGTCAR